MTNTFRDRLGKSSADFLAELAKPDVDEEPLVQELIYTGETTFLVADPSVGKSTLATQIAICLTVGAPVFDIFEVARPTTVYYIALETRWRRQIRTIRRMSVMAKPDFTKLYWDDPIGVDLTEKRGDLHEMITRIKKIWAQPGLVILDPLYLMVSQDLKDGATARAVSCFLNRLMNETGCACLVLHHTHRERTEAGKKVVEEDAIYGSRWLQAHMAVGWNIRRTPRGTHWKLTKDRFNESRPEFDLQYDKATQWSSGASSMRSSVTAKLQTLFASEPEGSLLTYEQLVKRTGNAMGYIKTLMHSDPTMLRFVDYVDNGPGKPAMWRIRPKNSQPVPASDTSYMDNLSIA